ncbi:Alpha/Beta hydrolase protein [Mariannaea sp. PMI_226]|nr:Alpha/Beta hydrolase protein [Mariannaea sp. PMI_226]
MRRLVSFIMRAWAFLLTLGALGLALEQAQQPVGSNDVRKSPPTAGAISTPFFATLERLARLVDITYCIGTTGVSKPFECVSRCNDFPNLSLVTTWNTGALMSDSCGFIALDHGSQGHGTAKAGIVFATGAPAIIVAFRGTYSITNTVIDLSTIPQKYVPYPSPDDGGGEPPEAPEHECNNCTVHMGFLSSWKSTRDLILPQLRELKKQHPSYPIQLMGHSLGGAVACLASLELKVSLGWDDVVVTTFGEPRVGNQGFAQFVDQVFDLDGEKNLEQRTYRRITHQDDPVPLLPMGEWGYNSHAGEIFISKKNLSPTENDVHMCIGDEDPQCIAKADGDGWDILSKMRRFFGNRESVFSVDQSAKVEGFPSGLKLWQLFFAHRDYFWRLGLCIPGGDPANWGQSPYEASGPNEL